MSGNPLDTLVPPGDYRVVFRKCDRGVAFGQTRLFCHFVIQDPGPHQGKPILRVYNAHRGPFLPRSHNMAVDFMALIERRPPAKGLQPRDFLEDCEVLARVATVTERVTGRGRQKLPERCWYSKIEALLAITAGCPPCLRRRRS